MASRPPRWGLWLLWVLASAVGGAVGVVPARIIGTTMGETVLGAVALGGVLGAIATAQWLVMRRRLSWAAWWVAATVVGGLVGGAVALGLLDALSANGHETLGAVLGTLAGLGAFGAIQWLILRRVTRAGWWAAAGIAGLVAAGPLGVGVLGQFIGDGGGFGAMYGAITGARFTSVILEAPDFRAGGQRPRRKPETRQG